MPTKRSSNGPRTSALPRKGTHSSPSPELLPVIEEAQQWLRRLRSCDHPPFWDQFDGWSEDFQNLLERMVRLRSLELLDACEYLEDLLAAVQDRRSEILRVTAYQILLALPPIGRRGASSALRAIDPRVSREVLAEIPLELHAEALEEPGWPLAVQEWVLEMSPRVWPLEMGPKGSRPRVSNSNGPFGPNTTAFLERMIQGLAKAKGLLPTPPAWVGSSCLDLRFENLSTLAEDHLARWPDPDILATALVGLSSGNRAKAFALFPDTSLRERVDQIGQGFATWREILQAQRQVGWWLQFVDLKREVLECYEVLKKATPSEAMVLMSAIDLKPYVLQGVKAMVGAYFRNPSLTNPG